MSFDLAHPPDRVQLGEEVVRRGRMHRGLDHAGRHRVDADALGGIFDRERLGRGGQGRPWCSEASTEGTLLLA